jgi:hypothetical protein
MSSVHPISLGEYSLEAIVLRNLPDLLGAQHWKRTLILVRVFLFFRQSLAHANQDASEREDKLRKEVRAS